MTLTPGARLGPYEILAPLGAGGMGEVYRARDTRLGREVALKTLPAQVASDPDRLRRFESEAKTVAGLNHPNIVVLHSIEKAGGVRFLTMELVEGQSLTQLLAPGGLPLSQVLDLALPLTDALVAAHEKGIVHRDLKPSNVMVTKDGRLKVLDFGLAKLAVPGGVTDLKATQETTVTSPLTSTGQVVGTVPYMAPEQLRGEAVDVRTDLFAMGLILYELVTGRRPFAGKSLPEVSSSILRDAPTPVTVLRPGLPPDIARIVGRCLEKDLKDRFQTAREVYNELRLVRRELEGAAFARAGSSASLPAPIADDAPSIAVLPFANMSKDEENEYFADGLSEELLNVLSKVRGLRVPSRTSSFHFKGKTGDIESIGRQLRVATVLEGSVRKSGRHVRISVQLVKVIDGYQLWSQTYDRELDDIFAVQDDIAQTLVKELRITLLGEKPDASASALVKAEVAAAAKGRSANPEAYRLYLQGRFFAGRGAGMGGAKGIEYYRQALRLDPGYALAWAGLSVAYSDQAASVVGAPFANGFAWAPEAAERSLQLEPDLAEGHAALGRIQELHDWDWKGAESSMWLALELAPGNADVIAEAARLASYLGKQEEAIALGRRAVTLDPLNAWAHASLGAGCVRAGLLDEAEAELKKEIDLNPHSNVSRIYLIVVHLARGHVDQAMTECERVPEEAWHLYGMTLVHHAKGLRAESNAALLQLIEKFAQGYAFQIAEACAYRGEADRAFEWMERAYIQRDPGLAMMKVDPLLRSLHADPQWQPFLEKMGLGG